MRKFDDIVPPSKRKDGDVGELRRERRRFPTATLLIALLIIAASVGALFYFSTAKIEVTPNTISASVQNSFNGMSESAPTSVATSTASGVPFRVITAQKAASQSVKSSGSKSVRTTASGSVTFYNTQGKPQRLMATTRIQSPSGLIYRIRSAITIPAGTASKPGQIEATAYADQPGDTYNIGPTSFTIPGLAGTPEASLVYARSTASMKGGASGSIPVVESALETSTANTLKSALAAELEGALRAQVPEGYVLLPGASSTRYETLAPTAGEGAGTALLTVQGTALGVVFPNAALASAIASSMTGLAYQGEKLSLTSTGDLSFAAVGGLPNENTASFIFTLSGTAPLVYTIEEDRIAAAVAGKSRSDAQVALKNYPEVKSAVIVLRPFWRQNFPDDPASITVSEQ